MIRFSRISLAPRLFYLVRRRRNYSIKFKYEREQYHAPNFIKQCLNQKAQVKQEMQSRQ